MVKLGKIVSQEKLDLLDNAPVGIILCQKCLMLKHNL